MVAILEIISFSMNRYQREEFPYFGSSQFSQEKIDRLLYLEPSETILETHSRVRPMEILSRNKLSSKS